MLVSLTSRIENDMLVRYSEELEKDNLVELLGKLRLMKFVRLIEFSLSQINKKLGNEEEAEKLIEKATAMSEGNIDEIDFEKLVYGDVRDELETAETIYQKNLFAQFTNQTIDDSTMSAFKKYLPDCEENKDDLFKIENSELEKRIMAIEKILADEFTKNMVHNDEIKEVTVEDFNNIIQIRDKLAELKERYSKVYFANLDKETKSEKLEETKFLMEKAVSNIMHLADVKKWYTKGFRLSKSTNFFDNPEDELKLTKYLAHRFLKLKMPKFEDHIVKKGKQVYLYFCSKIGTRIESDEPIKWKMVGRYRKGRFPARKLMYRFGYAKPFQDHIRRLQHAQKNVDALQKHETDNYYNDLKNQFNRRIKHYLGEIGPAIYPEGFRHYESLDKYRLIHPHATVSEYMESCNLLSSDSILRFRHLQTNVLRPNGTA